MSTVLQKLSVDFHETVKSSHVNAIGFKIIPCGVYEGGEVTFSGNTATVAAGTIVYLYALNSSGESGYPVGVRVELLEDLTITGVSSTDCYICLYLNWEESQSMEVTGVACTREVLADRGDLQVVLCRAEREADGSSYVADYSVKTLPYPEVEVPPFYVDVLSVHEDDSGERTSVYVNPGKLFVDRQYADFAGASLKITTNPRPSAGKVRFDMVAINPYTGVLSVVAGVEQTNFNTYPRIPRLTKVLAFIKRYPATGTAGLYRTNDVVLASDIIQLGEQQDQNFEDNEPIGAISMFDGATWVDNVTKPGWYACIAENAIHGCPDLVDSFVMGKANTGLRGSSSGANTLTLTSNQLPEHTHNITAHSHTIQSHTHTINTHTHTIPTHSHTVNSHTHTIGSHGHGENSHTHTLAGHRHSFSVGPNRLEISYNTHNHWMFAYGVGTVSDPDLTEYDSNPPAYARNANGDYAYAMKSSSRFTSFVPAGKTYTDGHNHVFSTVGSGANSPVDYLADQTTNGASGAIVQSSSPYESGYASPTTNFVGPVTTSDQTGGTVTNANTGALSTNNNTSALSTQVNATMGQSIDNRPKNYSLIYVRKCY